jgi:hypothetical protein
LYQNPSSCGGFTKIRNNPRSREGPGMTLFEISNLKTKKDEKEPRTKSLAIFANDIIVKVLYRKGIKMHRVLRDEFLEGICHI